MISVSYSFNASHAVADDPRLSHQQRHYWTLTCYVRGDLVGPGWVMDFGDLRKIMVDVVAEVHKAGSTNAWLDHRNATAEVLVNNLARAIDYALPETVRLVRADLEEAPGCVAHWERGAA